MAREAEQLGPGRALGPDPGEGLAAVGHDAQDVGQRLDVVDDRRLAEQPDLDRERRLVARLAALALDRLEERRLLAADVGAGAAPELDVEGEARAQDVVAEEAGLAGTVDGVGHARLGLGVLAADVEVALRGAGREGGDRHRLDGRERVALEQDAVLERARLGFVGVADEVVGLRGLGGDRGPLATGREGRAATAEEPRFGDLGGHALGAHLEGAGEGRVAAVGPVVVERGRVDDADPAQQARPLVGRLRDVRQAVGRRAAVCLEDAQHAGGIDRGEREGRWRLAGVGDHHGRRAVAQPQARTAQPRRAAVPCRLPGRPDAPRQVRADRLRAGEPAGDVVADVGHDGRPRGRGEESVEGGHAVGLGRSDGQALADVVECRGADPADPRLDRVECRDQQGAAGPRCVAAARCVSVGAAVAGPPTQPDSGGPRTASTAARSAGEASGPMTCRSIKSSVATGPGEWRRRRRAGSAADTRVDVCAPRSRTLRCARSGDRLALVVLPCAT